MKKNSINRELFEASPEKRQALRRKFWKSLQDGGELKKTQTGIEGLDDILQGGVPVGRGVLIKGRAGTGKTVLMSEFVYRGITEFNENAVYVTFEETPADLAANVKSWGWDFSKLVKQNKLAYVDCSAAPAGHVVGGQHDLTPVLLRIKNACKKTKAKRLVIDGLSSILLTFSAASTANLLTELNQFIKEQRLTALFSGPDMNHPTHTGFLIEEHVPDGVIHLEYEHARNHLARHIKIIKLRGVSYKSGRLEFAIGPGGIQTYAKIPVDFNVARTNFDIRKSVGDPALDAMIEGGVPEGHTVLISGNTGTGKSTLGFQFIQEGLKQGENGLIVALEESRDQILRVCRSHGWNLEPALKQKRLSIANPDLVEFSTERLVNMIFQGVMEVQAKRVLLDSVSTIKGLTKGQDISNLLILISRFFKNLGITSMVTYLNPSSFGSSKDQLLGELMTSTDRLSSAVDGIFLMNYVERGQKVRRLFNVLKMRGSDHSKDIFKYEITGKGFQLSDKYEI